MTEPAPQAGRLTASFRDPSGRLCRYQNRILRVVARPAIDDLRAFLASKLAASWMAQGRLVSTTVLDDAQVEALRRASPELDRLAGASDLGLIAEHEAIPFASYPHEWPAEMLAEAGALTLELAQGLLPHGLGLKDATPYNVLYRGATAVFVDVLSVERRDQRDARWLPYAQFVRTFLLPLLVNRRLGLPAGDLFLSRRDGLEPEDAARLFGPLRRWMPPVLTLATLPARLGRGGEQRPAAQTTQGTDPEKAAFILKALLAQLSRTLERLTPPEASSHWSDYMATRTHYSDRDQSAKTGFVEQSAAELRPARALDIGCNTGHFSEILARAGASVVAVDADAAVAGSVWRRARERRLDILPLVVNLARPTPAVGWLNDEYSAFLDRARGRFDLVLMLAVLHHLLVTERVPLDEVMELAAAITRDSLVIEYVGPDDVMFRKLARGRDHLFVGLTREGFERACLRHFEIAKSERLPESDRWLYLLRRRQPAPLDA
jgi:SAM-dependent methyltransferase